MIPNAENLGIHLLTNDSDRDTISTIEFFKKENTMYCTRIVTSDLVWIGADDRRLPPATDHSNVKKYKKMK